MTQHPRRSGSLERNGQRDDWGVATVSFRLSVISEMIVAVVAAVMTMESRPKPEDLGHPIC
ncbi:MAG: hypothetical protein KAV00_06675 [Phycisphaerae bacterium]|nr:hypothetical protein [Phycisphaerae bacterium]